MNAGQKLSQERRAGPSEDYHDYVFKDGQLIGDFDNMYRYSRQVPWDQDTRCDHWYAEVGVLMLKVGAPYDAILEIGCGLGYISAKLKAFARRTIDAFDISPEAIKRAQSLHAGIGFYVDDIVRPSFQPKQQYDLVVIRDIFWYVFPQLTTVIQNINTCVKPNGSLYICQSFPALDSSFVGKEILPSPEALIRYFQHYEPVFTASLRNHQLVQDGPMLHFLGTKAK